RQFYLSPTTDYGFYNKGTHISTLGMDYIDLFFDFPRVQRSSILAPIFSPKSIGKRKNVGMLRSALPPFPIELVRTDIDAHIGITVIAHFGCNDIPFPSGRLYHTDGQLIGLAARIYKMQYTKFGGQGL